MQITFKLFATLMRHLPPEAKRHAVTIDVADAITPNQLIARFAVPRSQVHLVLVNGVYLAEGERDTPLRDGDQLAIWPPVAGG